MTTLNGTAHRRKPPEPQKPPRRCADCYWAVASHLIPRCGSPAVNRLHPEYIAGLGDPAFIPTGYARAVGGPCGTNAIGFTPPPPRETIRARLGRWLHRIRGA